MKPVVLFPYHDPDGVCRPYLERILPDLKDLFSGAFLGVDPPTYQKQTGFIDTLLKDPFFHISFSKPGSTFGDHCVLACERAVVDCAPEQVVHFCFIDRLAFALQSEHRDKFIADIRETGLKQAPVLFQRSKEAWQTHPSNYLAIEQMAVTACSLMLNQPFDLTWCHMALTAGHLASILPSIQRRDMVMLGEMVLLLRDDIRIQEVDWLAWEDPFILNRDYSVLKAERENDINESRKRLAYVIPTLSLLYEKIGPPAPLSSK